MADDSQPRLDVDVVRESNLRAARAIVPAHVNFRVDRQLRDELGLWFLAQIEHASLNNQRAPNLSQGVRILLSTSIREQDEVLSVAFRQAAFNEGITAGVAKVREQLERSLNIGVNAALGALGDFDGS